MLINEVILKKNLNQRVNVITKIYQNKVKEIP